MDSSIIIGEGEDRERDGIFMANAMELSSKLLCTAAVHTSLTKLGSTDMISHDTVLYSLQHENKKKRGMRGNTKAKKLDSNLTQKKKYSPFSTKKPCSLRFLSRQFFSTAVFCVFFSR